MGKGLSQEGDKNRRLSLMLIVVAMFLIIVGGAVSLAYAMSMFSASYNPNSNLTKTLYNESLARGYNYTVTQIQSLMRQASEAIMGVSAFMIVLGVLTWLFVYRPDTAGQYSRASLSALMLGILYILVGLEGLAYSLLLCIIGGGILIYVWYNLRKHARLAAVAASPSDSGSLQGGV
jgi:uncharacterized membrane protein